MTANQSTANPLGSKPSQVLFPTMMQNTKLLVIDYDVTRMHSFDLFRNLLLDREKFEKVSPRFYPMLEMDGVHQLDYYITHCVSLNPYDNFEDTHDQMTLYEFEDKLKDLIVEESMLCTSTDLNTQMHVVFENPTITGYLLKYPFDPTEISWSNIVKTYTSEHMLDMRMAAALIEKYSINAVIISSIDAALILLARLEKDKYYSPISFIIGTYFYNYEPETGVLKHLEEFTKFELVRKHEFGVFSPYGNLHRLVQSEGDEQQA